MLAGLGADDLLLDGVWLAVERGDPEGAARAAAAVRDPVLAQRARLDALASGSGRAAALDLARREDSWLQARYTANADDARTLLDAVPREQRDLAHGLEDARRSPPARREAIATSLLTAGAASSEALALLVESQLDRGRFGPAAHLLSLGPTTARLRALQRRLDLSTGRVRAAVRGLLDDLREGALGAGGLQLLERALLRIPMEDLEGSARVLLRADDARGDRYEPARARLLAQLELRAGHAREGVAALASLDPSDPVDDRLARRVRLRAGLAVEAQGRVASGASPRALGAETPEERVDGDPQRAVHRDVTWLRTADEWSLAARGAYREALRDDEVLDLAPFAERLDEATTRLGDDVPRLAGLPRRSFGLFGEMLATAGLEASLPGAFVLAGQGLLLPAELTLYDRIASTEVSVRPGAEGEGADYRRVLVAGLRVPGFVASQGAEFSGAGLVDVVFLDVDQVLRQVRGPSRRLAPEPLPAWPAADTAARRSLSEPLDTAARLLDAARVSAGDDFGRRVLEALALHEERHILDVQHLLRRSVFGMLLDVLSAGGTPAAVRAEVERRAQLDALRLATDPRLPLAHVVASVVDDAQVRGGGEHAAGYETLLAELVEVLDEGRWEGARPLAELGLDRGRVLVQQLWRLDPETVRALARAVEL